MAWSCEACTYRNDNDVATHCILCEIPRKTILKAKQKTKQSTLFGSVAVEPKSRKRTAAVAAVTSKGPPSSIPPPNTEKDVKSLAKRTKEVMKTVFGIKKLRNLQSTAISATLRGESQLIVLATGGGKSLCYQLPAVVLGGTTLVISPLIALMKDQLQYLQSKKISAAMISSSQSATQNSLILQQMNKYTLIYCTPEQIQNNRFQKALQSIRLTAFAVDEAHCVSSWGHDFRPAYRQLGWLRENFAKVPCMACTATATPTVIRDIRESLSLPQQHVGDFDRPNIFYKVRVKAGTNDLLQFCQRQHEKCRSRQQPCSGIIYVHKRQETVELAQAFAKTNISTVAYHGALSAAQRTQIQEDWTKGVASVAICTVAFGMGIDLAHVRYVVHWSLPKTLEGFYQESGRAGRDGLPCYSLVYYSRADARKMEFLIMNQTSKKKKDDRKREEHQKWQQRQVEALHYMVDYCSKAHCRRSFILKYFGSKPVLCQKTCDYCQNPAKVEAAMAAAANEDQFQFYSRPAPAFEPVGDNDDDDENDLEDPYDAGDLQLTSAEFESAPRKRPRQNDFEVRDHNSFLRGSTSLNAALLLTNEKSQAIEKGKGFVNFKRKGGGFQIPQHLLRPVAPVNQADEPNTNKKEGKESPSMRVERLKKELAAIQAKRTNCSSRKF